MEILKEGLFTAFAVFLVSFCPTLSCIHVPKVSCVIFDAIMDSSYYSWSKQYTLKCCFVLVIETMI